MIEFRLPTVVVLCGEPYCTQDEPLIATTIDEYLVCKVKPRRDFSIIENGKKQDIKLYKREIEIVSSIFGELKGEINIHYEKPLMMPEGIVVAITLAQILLRGEYNEEYVEREVNEVLSILRSIKPELKARLMMRGGACAYREREGAFDLSVDLLNEFRWFLIKRVVGLDMSIYNYANTYFPEVMEIVSHSIGHVVLEFARALISKEISKIPYLVRVNCNLVRALGLVPKEHEEILTDVYMQGAIAESVGFERRYILGIATNSISLRNVRARGVRLGVKFTLIQQ